jgi:shikimate kinase
MGAGKTTIGKLLARSLAIPFCDCDQEICKATGVDVATIFEIEGEEAFRDRETHMLYELVARPRSVIATGGGAVIRSVNRELLAGSGTVLYLHVSPDTVWSRIKTHRGRPLLATRSPLDRLQELYAQRDGWYREVARHVVDVTCEAPSAVAERAVAMIGGSANSLT